MVCLMVDSSITIEFPFSYELFRTVFSFSLFSHLIQVEQNLYEWSHQRYLMVLSHLHFIISTVYIQYRYNKILGEQFVHNFL